MIKTTINWHGQWPHNSSEPCKFLMSLHELKGIPTKAVKATRAQPAAQQGDAPLCWRGQIKDILQNTCQFQHLGPNEWGVIMESNSSEALEHWTPKLIFWHIYRQENVASLCEDHVFTCWMANLWWIPRRVVWSHEDRASMMLHLLQQDACTHSPPCCWLPRLLLIKISRSCTSGLK